MLHVHTSGCEIQKKVEMEQVCDYLCLDQYFLQNSKMLLWLFFPDNP